jgi:hypothetical protein
MGLDQNFILKLASYLDCSILQSEESFPPHHLGLPFLRDFYASNIEKVLGFRYLEVHIHVEHNIP